MDLPHRFRCLGEFGNDTWEKDSWKYTGNTGAWGQVAIDEELNMAYLPIELPTGDYYGGTRPGNNLFSETLVAVDLKTGVRKWHYQFVHHGIWDFDMAAPPILADITVNGRAIKAIAQPTKQAWLYVFDRTNGQPVWPIVERPVEKGDVPGEWYSPTQPFVTKPPAFDRQGVSVDDLIDFTPELRAEALKLVSRYKIGPLFTPPVVSKVEGPLATLHMPLAGGGANWPGGSYDPETHVFYVYSQSAPGIARADSGAGRQRLRLGIGDRKGESAARAARPAVAAAAVVATRQEAVPAAGRRCGAGPAAAAAAAAARAAAAD